MQVYFVSIAAVVLACGSVQYLAGDLKLKKQIFFIASLCIVFSLFAPMITWFPTVLDRLDGAISTDTSVELPHSDNQALLAEGTSAVERSICEQIQKIYGLRENDISVTIALSYKEIDNIYIEKIDVKIRRKTDAYLEMEIEKYLEKLFGCEVCVTIGGV